MLSQSDKSDPHPFVDPKSLYGKFPGPREHVEILVIGAGPAGLAAAIEAARLGATVKLVDENPISGELIGMDVPLFYGGRASAGVQNKERMIEQIVATNPRIEEAFEAGIDVVLGTYAWGAFVNGPGMQTLPNAVVGLADESEAWLCGFDRLIVATGSRDLVMFFEGADQPGVMGAQALHSLLRSYEAFDGRSVLILGSDDLAVDTAMLVLERGLSVVGMIEARDMPQAAEARIAAVRARGIEVLCGSVIRSAERGPLGVTAAVIVEAGGAERRILCDTICLAIDRVPSVELLDIAGASLVVDGTRGGWVPHLDCCLSTTLRDVFVAGDCAGLCTAEAAAMTQGIEAARAATRSLGHEAPDPAVAPSKQSVDRHAYRLDWMRALLAVGDFEVLACQCEEVTRGALLGVRPPRYLGTPPEQGAARGLDTLLTEGPVNQDQIKRLTRACMGPCQARRCREQIAMILAIGSGIPLEHVPLAGYRAPARPLPLGLLGTVEELSVMREKWDVWFGIPTQWVPYADIGTSREAAFLGGNMHL